MKSGKTLIFDFDGTIADSGEEVLEIINKILPSFKIRKVEASEYKELGMQKLIKKLDIPMYKLALIYFKFSQEYKKVVKDFKPIKGIPEVLAKLDEKKVNMYIASSSPEESIKIFLENNNLRYFKNIKGSGGILGKRRILRKIIKEEKLSPEDVIYIGDEIRDIESAREAGIKSAAVTWGFNNKEFLKEYGPDYLVSEPKGLLYLE